MSRKEVIATIRGTPFQAGAGVWEQLVLPCFSAVRDQPPMHVKQFYAGILTACMGAMVADFGHQQAVNILRTLADSLDSMRDDLPGSRTQ